jgi:hypothetical protein
LGASHFWWWKKRLHTPLTKFVEVKLTPTVRESAGARPASRAEVRVQPAGDLPPVGEERVEVVLRNGRSLWVGRGFDARHVRALAAVLESEA